MSSPSSPPPASSNPPPPAADAAEGAIPEPERSLATAAAARAAAGPSDPTAEEEEAGGRRRDDAAAPSKHDEAGGGDGDDGPTPKPPPRRRAPARRRREQQGFVDRLVSSFTGPTTSNSDGPTAQDFTRRGAVDCNGTMIRELVLNDRPSGEGAPPPPRPAPARVVPANPPAAIRSNPTQEWTTNDRARRVANSDQLQRLLAEEVKRSGAVTTGAYNAVFQKFLMSDEVEKEMRTEPRQATTGGGGGRRRASGRRRQRQQQQQGLMGRLVSSFTGPVAHGNAAAIARNDYNRRGTVDCDGAVDPDLLLRSAAGGRGRARFDDADDGFHIGPLTNSWTDRRPRLRAAFDDGNGSFNIAPRRMESIKWEKREEEEAAARLATGEGEKGDGGRGPPPTRATAEDRALRERLAAEARRSGAPEVIQKFLLGETTAAAEGEGGDGTGGGDDEAPKQSARRMASARREPPQGLMGRLVSSFTGPAQDGGRRTATKDFSPRSVPARLDGGGGGALAPLRTEAVEPEPPLPPSDEGGGDDRGGALPEAGDGGVDRTDDAAAEGVRESLCSEGSDECGWLPWPQEDAKEP